LGFQCRERLVQDFYPERRIPGELVSGMGRGFQCRERLVQDFYGQPASSPDRPGKKFQCRERLVQDFYTTGQSTMERLAKAVSVPRTACSGFLPHYFPFSLTNRSLEPDSIGISVYSKLYRHLFVFTCVVIEREIKSRKVLLTR